MSENETRAGVSRHEPLMHLSVTQSGWDGGHSLPFDVGNSARHTESSLQEFVVAFDTTGGSIAPHAMTNVPKTSARFTRSLRR